MDLSVFLNDLPMLALGALAVSAMIFPIVFLMSFVYESLAKKHENAPKILLMLIATFIGVLIAILVIYVYVGVTLTQALAFFA